MSKIIESSKTFEQIRAAGLIQDDPRTISRIIIDLQAGKLAKIYVEHLGDHDKLGDLFAAGITVDETAAP